MSKLEIWGDYTFEIATLHEAQKSTNGCVFIFAGKSKSIWEKASWIPYFIGETENFQTLFKNNIWTTAQNLGATHVHIKVSGQRDRKLIIDKLIASYKPAVNQSEQFINSKSMESTMSQEKFINSKTKSMEPTMSEALQINENAVEMPNELLETEAKLELLYQYERHYLDLIKEYKEEIKFANTLQEDLRRERSQFFTQTLKDVVQTMKNAEVDKNVAAQWLEDLVSSYSKSIDLSSDLAKTHVVQVLSIFKEEAKQEITKAKLDSQK